MSWTEVREVCPRGDQVMPAHLDKAMMKVTTMKMMVVVMTIAAYS